MNSSNYIERLIKLIELRIKYKNNDGHFVAMEKDPKIGEGNNWSIIFLQSFNSMQNDGKKSVSFYNQKISQNRIAIEVLRSFLDNQQSNTNYLQTAYHSFLRSIGTSYNEIRLLPEYIPGENASDKNVNRQHHSLSSRLGISPSKINELLYIPSERLNENALQELYGLINTSLFTYPGEKYDSLAFLNKSSVYGEKLSSLRSVWKQQDGVKVIDQGNNELSQPININELEEVRIMDSDGSTIRFPKPVLDPDILGQAEILNIDELSALNQFEIDDKKLEQKKALERIHEIFEERDNFINDEFAAIDQLRNSFTTSSLEAFDKTLSGVLEETAYQDSDVQEALEGIEPENLLKELLILIRGDKPSKQKIDVDAILNYIPLTTDSLTVLGKIQNLAANNKIEEEEWKVFYTILVDIKKHHKYKQWSLIEVNEGIFLDPIFFKRAENLSISNNLTGNWNKRQDWEDKLNVRITQQKELLESYQTILSTTETTSLPILRDWLLTEVKTKWDNTDKVDMADWLSQRFFIDFKSSGDQRISRIDQALETLQDFILSLRAGHFSVEELQSTGDTGTPVLESLPNWEIAYSDKYSESHFDAEWKWYGSFNAWRGAMFAINYPENYLLPTLWYKTQAQTPQKYAKCTIAFKKLVKKIRQSGRLTAAGVESLAKFYVETLKKPFIENPTEDESSGDGVDIDNIPGNEDKDFKLTGYLSRDELNSLRFLSYNMLKTHFEDKDLFIRNGTFNYPIIKNEDVLTSEKKIQNARIYCLMEIFFFVPMLFAQTLQKNGEFLSALDWYQRVYSFEKLSLTNQQEEVNKKIQDENASNSDKKTPIPFDEHKIYYGLKEEEFIENFLIPNYSSLFIEMKGDRITGLDVFDIANDRANAYTSHTILFIARCYLAYADAEFTRESNESIVLARRMYMNALKLLESLPEPNGKIPPNPIKSALLQHGAANLQKLHNNLNIAGMERIRRKSADIEVTTGEFGLTLLSQDYIRATAYRYSVLIERSKQLTNLAQQIEANFLSALEKRDNEAFNLQLRNQSVDLTQEAVELQGLRVKDADFNINITTSQRERTQLQIDTYSKWINSGPNEYEGKMLDNYKEIRKFRNTIASFNSAISIANSYINATGSSFFEKVAAYGLAGTAVTLAEISKLGATDALHSREEDLQRNSFHASHERRKDEWGLQRSLAEKDLDIINIQIDQAKNNKLILKKEEGIAKITATQAEANVEFLRNKFTNVELYEWMSDVLSGIYNYFLQQATATAQLAASQLSFERQERLPAFINNDYWQSVTSGLATIADEKTDRRGLTGSARLLQDIYKLDQHAFETNKRKHQLVQNFSLAQLFPYEFQQFRTTGILPFVTPMSMFDQGFPGHYLRLIKRIRISIIALIPPLQGIRATLASAGVSRVVTGGDIFRETEIQRPSDMIAFTSPSNATGLFEMQPENEMLLPFETMGVDSSWELRLPKAANHFNFDSIADVIFSMEYTSLHSFDYQKQVVEKLDRDYSAERPYSIKQDFPDLWYNLQNPESIAKEDGSIDASFNINQTHFSPNLERIKIDKIIVYFVRSEKLSKKIGDTSELEVDDLMLNDSSVVENSGARSINGVISTRSGGANNWLGVIGQQPVGKWSLVFSKENKITDHLKNEDVTDILFVLGYSGETPAWI